MWGSDCSDALFSVRLTKDKHLFKVKGSIELKVVYYTAMYDVYVYDVRVCVCASWGLSVADSQLTDPSEL